MSALIQYLAAVLDDGDYLNDWLTHLPTVIRPTVQLIGYLLAAFS
jgi:hypothetical protein